MIRGIDGVIANHHELVLGRFYLDPGFGQGVVLFQWVRTGGDRDGEPAEGALVYARDDKPCLELGAAPTGGPWVALPDVSIRVDPPSAKGTAFNTRFGQGTFAVEEGKAIVGAAHDGAYWTTIDILSGRVTRPGHKWVAFDRWSLIVDEAGEEIPIVSFGEFPSA